MMILAIYNYIHHTVRASGPYSSGKKQKPQPVCGLTYVIRCYDIIVYTCTFNFWVYNTAYDVCQVYKDTVHRYSLR